MQSLYFVPNYHCMKSSNPIPVVSLTEEIRLESHVEDENLANYFYPHRLDPGCLLFVTEGTADVTINLLHTVIHKHNIVTLMPGSIVQLTNHSDDFNAEILIFSREIIKDISFIKSAFPYIEIIRDNPVLTVSNDYAELMADYYSILSRLYRKLKKDVVDKGGNIMQNLLFSFFHGVIALYERISINNDNSPSSRGDEIIRELRNLIIAHYQKERSLSFYADKLHLTPKYLSEVCKRMTGKRVADFISELVIFDAQSQLKSTTLTILQISDSLNFPNPSFFSTYFKQHTGMSPKEYRNSGK